jgi:hypothetical protein
MKKRNVILSTTLAAVLACAGIVVAQRPGVDIGRRHANLEEAQRLIQQAYGKIEDAQGANHGHLGGHAEKAKQLLNEASRELKEAAEYANQRERRH